MGEVLRSLLSHFMSEKCYNEYFLNFNFSDTNCLIETLCKGLGVGIIIGSTLVKFPQILKIFNCKSAEGISFLSVLLELVAVTSSASYNFAKGYPFSSWGESLFLMLETATIACLVLLYSGNATRSGSFAVVYSMITYILFNGLVPISALWNLQAANVPIVVAAKMIQAVKNYGNGHTGQLSMVTMTLLFLGCVVRIFTTIQETGDAMLTFTYIIATLFNGVIVAQILYYWKTTEEVLRKKKKKKQ